MLSILVSLNLRCTDDYRYQFPDDVIVEGDLYPIKLSRIKIFLSFSWFQYLERYHVNVESKIDIMNKQRLFCHWFKSRTLPTIF